MKATLTGTSIESGDTFISLFEYKDVDADPEEVVRIWQDEEGMIRIAVNGQECKNRVALRKAFLAFASTYELSKHEMWGEA